MSIKKNNFWFVNYCIKKYIYIDDVLYLINCIDKKMCFEDKIFNTNINIKISRTNNTQVDYVCELNNYCSKEEIIKYLDYKFKQTENFIKFYNHDYGLNWYIEFTIE